MNKVALALTLALGLTGLAAHAATKVTDTNGDGVYSIEELTAAYPKMTPALFKEIDVDGNGSVDADELQAARENGLLAP